MNGRIKRTRSGQTIVVALLIMGVLLALGFVFAGLISRNIAQTGRSFRRTAAGDLAESGIRFAHTQLLNSTQGADWRPEPTFPVVTGGFTRDPDALYTRPGTGLRIRRANGTLSNLIDRGGPDGLGPFSRINFDRGRSLTRVLYLPSDFTLFGDPSGVLKQPGKARYFLRVESVGRVGRVDASDPTTLLSEGVRLAGFVNDNDFNDELGKMRMVDTRNIDQKKQIAFVSLGLIEHVRFVTNKGRQSRAAEIGSLTAAPAGPEQDGLGMTNEGQPVVVPTFTGGEIFDVSNTRVARGTGSMHFNSDVTFHGQIFAYLNPALGDSITVAGQVRSANAAAQVNILRVDPANNNNITTIGLNGPGLSSTNPGFSTAEGLFRDGTQDIDGQGYTRGVGYKEPPSFLTTDPSTGTNRYYVSTRDSGEIINGRNSGRFGHGQGVYVDARDRANSANETEREAAGAVKSLPNDWLKPNNPTSIAWKGPFYIPVASYVQLYPDGFAIIRDSRAANADQRFWRRPDGSVTGNSRIRFRLRTITVAGGIRQTYSINSVANPALIDLPAGSLTDTNFENSGQPFNGLIVLEGDARVRGVIPTDHQITLISMGSVYIEGSITKGVIREDGSVLNRPSSSALMLMAQDYVALNSTMFFGPAVGEQVNPKNTDPIPNTPNPVELTLSTSKTLTLQTEFLRNPVQASGVPNSNPQTWDPYLTTYTHDRTSGGTTVGTPWLVLQHAADDNGPSFVRVGMTPRSFADPTPTSIGYYRFHNVDPFQASVIQTYNVDTWNLMGSTATAIYGLTRPARSAYPRFETLAMRLTDGTLGSTARLIGPNAASLVGNYALALQDPTNITLEVTETGVQSTKNYALARVGVNPHDVRIECAMYAENGSFFVIPGPGFNMNSEDTREAFDASVASVGLTSAQQIRFDDFGAMPGAPFYGEPLNCRVTIVGAINENMPAPIGQQAEWQKKWGWMPRLIGGTGLYAPRDHIPANWGSILGGTPVHTYLPNLQISYDPVLALGSADGSTPVRTSPDGLWVLPPMPRLPVSPTFAYFGEENP